LITKYRAPRTPSLGLGKANLPINSAPNKMCKPREWFIVQLEAIEPQAVNGLLDGSIVDYRHTPIRERVIEK